MANQKYIDYEQVDEDFKKLHNFIQEELSVSKYRELMLLLKYTQQNLQPKQAKASKSEDATYIG